MSNRVPLGLKILVGLSILGTVLGMIGAIIVGLGMGSSTGSSLGLILIPLVIVFGSVNLLLMYGLLRLNKTAYHIVIALYTLSLISNILSVQILIINYITMSNVPRSY